MPTESDILAALEPLQLDQALGDWPRRDGAPAVPGDDSRFERFHIPLAQDQYRDAYNYDVLLDADTGRFWILRSGGFTGRVTTFGPATLVNGRVVPAEEYADPAQG